MTNLPEVRTHFRHDINGLRAWAVIAVIFYHFGVTGFNGGFIGVDVFFVISGFLMTGIVIKGLERGSFSVIGFYMARGRRILPALLVLCAVLLALGWFVLLPPDYKLLSSHSVYALTFLSNVEFWQEAGYFDAASHEKWLLHTWSLSVEWQFYLILPLALWVVWRLKPGRLVQAWSITVLLVASLSASIWVTSTQPSTAFYLLHTRAWEMLTGGLVFLLATNLKLSDAQRRWIESAGLLLIVLAIGVFDKDTVWPSWRAMLPVVASALVLVANRSSIWTASWLAQWLGDRSYSLYLWHWPVAVAIVYLDLRDNSIAITGAIFLTVLLGHLSYVGVENTSRRFLEQQRVFTAGAGLTLAIALVTLPALGVWKWQGVLGRFSPAVEAAAAEVGNINQLAEKCFLGSGYISPSCVVGGTNGKVIAVGDSHVNATISAISQADKPHDAGVIWWAYGGCPYVPGLKISPIGTLAKKGETYQCPEFLNWTQKQLEDIPRNVPIIIINRYGLAAFGYNENLPVREIPEVYFSKHYSSPTAEFLTEFGKHVTDEACKLAKQRTVYMMRPIPEMGFDVPKTLSRRMAAGLNDDLYISMAAYQKRNAWVWAAQDAARDQCGIRILDPTPYLCSDGRCYGSKSLRPLYFDDDHLSEFGNKLLVPMFEEVFRPL